MTRSQRGAFSRKGMMNRRDAFKRPSSHFIAVMGAEVSMISEENYDNDSLGCG